MDKKRGRPRRRERITYFCQVCRRWRNGVTRKKADRERSAGTYFVINSKETALQKQGRISSY